ALFVTRENDNGNAHPRDGSTFPENAARISRGHAIIGNVLRYDRTGADETARANAHPRHNESARTDEGVVANGDFGGDELKRRVRKIVSAGAEIDFLGHGGARANFNFA